MKTATHIILAGLITWVPIMAASQARAGDPRPWPRSAPGGARNDTAILLRELDERAAAAAAARPSFAFPARIGIARLENGSITSMPADEWESWRRLRDQLPASFGELTPVTGLVAQSLTTSPLSTTPHDSITHLRLAAAREQLDAILLYEVSTTQSLENTELTLLDATIVGAWWFPTHRSHIAAHAAATLIDVRSGLAYGSAIGSATDACSATMLGSEEKIVRQRAATVRKAVAGLTPEVGALLTRLTQGTPRGERDHATQSPTPTTTTPHTPAADDHVIPPPSEERGADFWGPR